MTDEELEAIEARCAGFRSMNVEPYRGAYEMMGLRQAVDDNETVLAYIYALKSENTNLQDLSDTTLHTAADTVKRVEAQNAAMREIVQAVAEAGVGDDYVGGTWLMFAGYEAEKVRDKARALLASETKEQGA